MDLSTILLGLSYLGCTLVGAAGGAVWAFWYVGRPEAEPVEDQPGESPMSPDQRSILRTQAAVLVALITIGVGIVWFVADRASDRAQLRSAEATNRALVEHAECLRAWGTEVVRELNDARGKRGEFDAASRWRDDVEAQLIRVFARLRDMPPTATDADIDAVLTEFRRADRAYEAAYARLPRADEAEPYDAPKLNC